MMVLLWILEIVLSISSIVVLYHGLILGTIAFAYVWEIYYVLLLATVCVGGILFWSARKKASGKSGIGRAVARGVGITLSVLLLLNAVFWTIGFKFYKTNYSTTKASELFLHLRMGTEGANMEPFIPVILLALGVFAVLMIVYVLVLIYSYKRHYMGTVIGLVCVLLLPIIGRGFLLVYAGLGVKEYLETTAMKSYFIEENFVNGNRVDVTFPEEKRNLIFIYVESMEMSLADPSVGGGCPVNVIPELTEIGLANVDFSESGVLNGGHAPAGSDYTVGALIGATAGIGLKPDCVSTAAINQIWEEDYAVDYLPNAYTLGDLLEENGYTQEFLLGSDANYTGRKAYFKNHGNYRIRDYYDAIASGRIPEDYVEWWGFEDRKLYEYAKEDILELAKSGQPFNMTMLTADTHFPGGYVCPLCEEEYEVQGMNVSHCASRQLASFIQWVQKQDFYENTTIVITGDHPSMDASMITEAGVSPEYDRRTYVAIINPAEGLVEQPRVYTTYDLYPTTVAALGATIEGNRLGLGVNLFSEEPTLAEVYGPDEISYQMMQTSEYYEQYLMGNDEDAWTHK